MSKRKKLVIALLASLTGISITVAGSAIVAYEALFPRFDRPDYALVAGEYCYDRVSDQLDRREFYYTVGENRLRGYYYFSQQQKGIVVLSHGLKSGADDYLPIIKYMVNAGFDVFAYDGTGTYDSDGKDSVGICQAIIDLEGTLRYIDEDPVLSRKSVFLIGHSMGGYAASSVLSICDDSVKACAAIASMNNGTTMMYEKAEEYVGEKIASIPAPVFNTYQRLLFQDYVQYDGVKGVNRRNIPVLIAHGVNDKVVTYDSQALIAHRNELTNPNVQYYIGRGSQGSHTGIWHSADALAYQEEVKNQLQLLETQKGEKLTEEEKADFYKTVDHARYSAVNQELMKKIVKMFESTL